MMAALRAVGGALGLMPKWVWYLLAAALLWRLALGWHAAEVRAHDKDVVAARDLVWQARFDELRAHADGVRQEAEALHSKISASVKGKHDAEVRDNARLADALSLRGPGKAAAPRCGSGDHPGVPAAAGGHELDRGDRDAAPAPMPAADRLSGLPAGARDDFAVIPWPWLVDRGREADDSRAEVIAWRSWYVQQSAAWEKMRAEPVPKR